MQLPNIECAEISIIGLGYVGLPLCIEFSKTKICVRTNKKLNRKINGFDIDKQRINELENNYDKTGEISYKELKDNKEIFFTSNIKDLYSADVYIVTVPTPIDEAKSPDINPLKKACESIGSSIKERSKSKKSCPVIIFESTVFPGLTEEICVKIIEKISPLIIVLLLIFTVKLFLSKFRFNKTKFDRNILYITFFSSIFLVIWFLKFPLYRFGSSYIAVTIISITCIFLSKIDNKNNINFFKNFSYMLIFLSIFGIIYKNISRIVYSNRFVYINYPWPTI